MRGPGDAVVVCWRCGVIFLICAPPAGRADRARRHDVSSSKAVHERGGGSGGGGGGGGPPPPPRPRPQPIAGAELVFYTLHVYILLNTHERAKAVQLGRRDDVVQNSAAVGICRDSVGCNVFFSLCVCAFSFIVALSTEHILPLFLVSDSPSYC